MSLFLILWNTFCVYLLIGFLLALAALRHEGPKLNRFEQFRFVWLTATLWAALCLIIFCEWLEERK